MGFLQEDKLLQGSTFKFGAGSEYLIMGFLQDYKLLYNMKLPSIPLIFSIE